MWVVPLKDKRSITITKVFQEILDESNCKPKKIWGDKGSKFYNISIKSWLQDNDIEMHSTYSEEKSFVSDRFIRTLKKKIYKYMISVSKNVYIDKLGSIVNKYNNADHSTVKMKLFDIKSST